MQCAARYSKQSKSFRFNPAYLPNRSIQISLRYLKIKPLKSRYSKFIIVKSITGDIGNAKSRKSFENGKLMFFLILMTDLFGQKELSIKCQILTEY